MRLTAEVVATRLETVAFGDMYAAIGALHHALGWVPLFAGSPFLLIHAFPVAFENDNDQPECNCNENQFGHWEQSECVETIVAKSRSETKYKPDILETDGLHYPLKSKAVVRPTDKSRTTTIPDQT